MQEPEPELIESGFDVSAIEWRVWLARFLVVGLVAWILAGATRTIVLTYFFGGVAFITTEGLISNPDHAARGTLGLLKACIAVESVAFRLWITSAVILAFLVVRDRSSGSS